MNTIWRVTPGATLTPFLTSVDVLAIAFSSGPVWGDHIYFLSRQQNEIDLMRVDPSGNVDLVVDGIAPFRNFGALANLPSLLAQAVANKLAEKSVDAL